TQGIYHIDDLVHPSVGVRGVTGGLSTGTRIIKVMINGVPVSFRPDLNAFIGPEFIPMEAVERVEIARGPLSALYGANAFVAVANVVTRHTADGSAGEVAVRGMDLRGNPAAGASGLWSYGAERWDVLLAFTADRLDRSGLRVSKTFAEQDPASARYGAFFSDSSRRDLSQPTGLYGNLRLAAGPLGTLTAQAGFQRHDTVADFQLSSVLTHQSRVALENVWTQVQLERSFSDSVSATAWVGYSRGRPTDEDRLFLTSSPASYFLRNYSYWAVDGLAKVSYAPSERFSLDLGADGSYEPQHTLYYSEVRDGDRAVLAGPGDKTTVTLSNAGVFAQGSGSPVSRLHLTGNFRVDFPSLFPVQYSWRAAAVYEWSDKVTTKLIAGRAFQTPPAVLLYGLPYSNANNVIGSATIASATPLRPQTMTSIEAAVSAKLLAQLTVEGSLFGQEVGDRIEFVQFGRNFRATNQGLRYQLGGELLVRGSVSRLSPYLGGSAVIPLSPRAGGGLSIEPLPLFPMYSGLVGLDVELPETHLRLNAHLRLVGPRGASQSNVLLNNDRAYSLPGYVALNVSVATSGLQLAPGLRTDLLFALQNLALPSYSDPGFGGIDVPNPGWALLASVRQHF
ncbi:MAG: TonB-dependent receptor plug domain-containing protein, partial [Myxococcaceae bacterium]